MEEGTILAIDDQPSNLRLLMEALEREGYQTVVALDGEEGLQRAEFVRPDLILLDVHMPGLDGFETCRRLKARAATADIPVVFMSALADVPDKLAGFAAGGVDYVTKPVDGAEVAARIRTHLQLDRLRRELARKNTELVQLAEERAQRLKVEGESAALRRLLDERDEMLRLLAHEVRQPLNNASAALEGASAALAAQGARARDGVGDEVDERVRTPLLRAQHVLDHVIGTLNNALAAATLLATAAPMAAADTEVDTLVRLVLHDIAPEDQARVRIDAQGGARTVRLQPVLMRLALCNLLRNALAYSPAAAPVTLRIADSDDPLAIVFEVADEGGGFPSALLPQLFDKGVRGPNAQARAGAGLGLYIVRKVVELHGGRIDVEPNRPQGSVVRLVLPQGVAG
jgi:signal transduction histidine kinase